MKTFNDITSSMQSKPKYQGNNIQDLFNQIYLFSQIKKILLIKQIINNKTKKRRMKIQVL